MAVFCALRAKGRDESQAYSRSLTIFKDFFSLNIISNETAYLKFQGCNDKCEVYHEKIKK